MLTNAKIERVQRLLALRPRLSQREIQHMARVSRDSVAGIANGTIKPLPEPDEDEVVPETEELIIGYCEECRCDVYIPCQACRVRRWVAKQKKKQNA